MDFDNSWQALFVPGNGRTYFETHRTHPFDTGASGYSAIDAWWLAEISRLIYRVDKVTRAQIFADVGLLERAFFDEAGTQCAFLETAPGSFHPPFAVLVFRGTEEFRDWLQNINAFSERWEGAGRVHEGFHAALEAVWDKVIGLLTTTDKPLYYTGHSLGAALALLAAALKPPRATYAFGCPLVGNGDFARSFDGKPLFRIVNNRDVVPTLPPETLQYVHAGEEQYIASDGTLHANPAKDFVERDKERPDPTYNDHRILLQPPQFLADHAPVNYVAHMERLV